MAAIKILLGLITLGIAMYYVFEGITWGKNTKDQPTVVGFKFGRIPVALIGVVVAFVLLGSVVVIPAGNRGVVFSQGSGIENRILGEGLSFVTPFLESVHLVDVHVVKTEAKASAASRDTQDVYLDVVVTYNPDPSKVNKLYQKFGEKDAVEQQVIAPAIQEEVKAVTPRFGAVDVVTQRHVVKRRILAGLTKRLAKSYLIVYDISINNITFNEDFARAIEDKVQQAQIAQKEELIVRQKTAQAAQAVATAKGQKEAAILVAQGQAEANRLIRESLTPELLTAKWIEKWDGIQPKVQTSGGTGTLIQLPKF